MSSISKLVIKAYSDSGFSSSKGEFTTSINPEDLKITSSIDYYALQGMGVPSVLSYHSSPPRLLSFKLLFDNTGIIPGAERSIMDQLKELQGIAYDVQDKTHSPNYIRVLWGRIDFKGRLVSLDISYSMFKPDGLPIRAQAAVAVIEEIGLIGGGTAAGLRSDTAASLGGDTVAGLGSDTAASLGGDTAAGLGGDTAASLGGGTVAGLAGGTAASPGGGTAAGLGSDTAASLGGGTVAGLAGGTAAGLASGAASHGGLASGEAGGTAGAADSTSSGAARAGDGSDAGKATDTNAAAAAESDAVANEDKPTDREDPNEPKSQPTATDDAGEKDDPSINAGAESDATKNLAASEAKVHEVKGGEDLPSIANKSLENPNAFKDLAKLNDLDSLRKLKEGLKIAVPLSLAALLAALLKKAASYAKKKKNYVENKVKADASKVKDKAKAGTSKS